MSKGNRDEDKNIITIYPKVAHKRCPECGKTTEKGQDPVIEGTLRAIIDYIEDIDREKINLLNIHLFIDSIDGWMGYGEAQISGQYYTISILGLDDD